MKKILITSALLSSLFLHSENAHALEINSDTSPSTQISQSELEKIGEEYNIQLDLTPSKETINTDLKFKNIDEFQKYLEENKTQLDLPQEQDTISIMENSTKNPLPLSATSKATTYKKYHKESWWSPLNGPVIGVLNMKNIDFNYHYKKNKNKTWVLTKLTGIESWQTGYHDIKWKHRKSDYTIVGTKDVNVIAHGTYILGVVIGNQGIGYKWNSKWEKYIELKKF